jgi:predicted transposase/invertase (TIGR01784 family)
MRLKHVLSSACIVGTLLSLMTDTEAALAELAGVSMRAARTAVRTVPFKTVRSYSADHKPWQHLPMEAIVRDVRYDETFKILLGEEGAEPRAVSFLNAVFQPKTDEDRIKDIRYLDGTMHSVVDRTLHFDVKIEGLCETFAGQRFIVEMQKARIPSHTNRWVYYGARELAAMGERNYRKALAQASSELRTKAHKEHYQRLDPVKVVTILDFDTPKTGEELKNNHDILVHWDIRERQSKDIATPLLSWTYVLLPRFAATLPENARLDFRGRPLEAWLYLMTRDDKEKVMVTQELVSEDDALAEGFHRLSHLTEAEAEGLHAGQVAFASRLDRELEKFEEGEKKGEKKAKIEIAREMLTDNVTLSTIVRYTGLSIDDIEALREG